MCGGMVGRPGTRLIPGVSLRPGLLDEQDLVLIEDRHQPFDIRRLIGELRVRRVFDRGADLSVEQLNGVTVYGAGDENIGEIEDLVASDTGEISEAVIGVGGFLGLGEKKVAVNFSDLQILTNEDKSDIRVYISATEDELKGLPEYEPEVEIQQ